MNLSVSGPLLLAAVATLVAASSGAQLPGRGGGSCRQANAVVRCAELPDGVGARYDRTQCVLVLSETTCQMFGIGDGDTLSQAQVNETEPRNIDDAVLICRTQHELTHRADGGAEENRACAEQKAYTMGSSCMRRFGEARCTGPRPAWDATACYSACLDMLHDSLAVVASECLCDSVDASCDTCSSVCRERFPAVVDSLPDFCDRATIRARIDGAPDCASITTHYCATR